jgi:type IV pilus assembly protein PilM
MARSTIGLDLGTSAVRAAEVTGKDPATLTRFAQLSLPPGAIAAGEIADIDAVATVLRDLWRRGEFRSKRVAVAVANQSVVVRQVDVPKMEEEDLRGALPYQVQDYIPIPIDDALLDFIVVDEIAGPEGPLQRLLAIAAQKTMVNAVVEALARAGLEAEAVDLAPLAALRALVDPIPPIAERTAEAIVDIGAGVTNLVVHEAGAPRLVRILPTGGSDITNALVTELKMSLEDAEARKISVGLPAEGKSVEPGAPTVIDQRARAFMDDIQRSLEYYQSQPESARVARVILTGGGSRLARLAERLAQVLRIPVEEGQALARLRVGDIGLSTEQLEQVSTVAAVAVGLTLED